MYCTLQDLKNEGVEVTDENSAQLTRRIAAAGEKIDAWLMQFFEPREQTYDLSGHGGKTLVLDIPVLELREITADSEKIPLDQVRVTCARRYLIREAGWPKGTYNIVVKGLFGCVLTSVYEGRPHYTTPLPIREACLRLVIRDLPRITDTAAQEERRRSRIIKETTDGHSYELDSASTGASGGTWSGDYEIDALLWPYKAPVRLALA